MSHFKKYKNFYGMFFLVLFVSVMLLFSVRGLPGNPTPSQLNTTYWKDNGPFELSPERGRYALLYSLVENHTFSLAPSLANFTAPDVGYWNNKYVSIFAPSISFLAIPGYIIGREFGLSQFGAFAWMSLFALFNVLLIRIIAIRLGANPVAATLAGLTFLFATPAYAYAVTIYEHHPSTFLMLLSIYLLIRYNNILSLIGIWMLYAFAFTVDYPNLFLMFPIALAAFFRSGVVETIHRKVTFRVSLPRLFTVAGVIIPLAFLFWYNAMAYGSPTKLSGSIPTIEGVNTQGLPVFSTNPTATQTVSAKTIENLPPPSALSFFEPRNMINGFYILLFSPDRGVLMYTPVVLFGIAGLILANKKRQKYIPIMVGIVGFNFLLYAMWGDPYGGWAFGGRYLIPSYAILSIYIALLLTYLSKKRFVILLFFIVFSYSVMVNTLGALTSNSNPPQIQAQALANQIHSPVSYTYMRNVNDLNTNTSKSFIFQAYASNYISAWQFYSYMTFIILTVSAMLLIYYMLTLKGKLKRGGNYAV